jgi:hypothetical protein
LKWAKKQKAASRGETALLQTICVFSKFQLYFFTAQAPPMIVIRKRTRNIKNRIFAMEAAPDAMPVKPKMAATIATIKNMTDHFNMILYLKFCGA